MQFLKSINILIYNCLLHILDSVHSFNNAYFKTYGRRVRISLLVRACVDAGAGVGELSPAALAT